MKLLPAIGMCLVLGACGVTGGKSNGDAHVGYTKTIALATQVPSKYCTVPTTGELDSELVPNTPCGIVLSQYTGLPAQVGTQLVGRAKLRRPALLRELTSGFNALPIPPEGVRNCPNDRGSEIVANLEYPHHQYLQITLTLTGCSTAHRGQITRSALGRSGEKLIGQLKRLIARH
jgi:hypothetical protein